MTRQYHCPAARLQLERHLCPAGGKKCNQVDSMLQRKPPTRIGKSNLQSFLNNVERNGAQSSTARSFVSESDEVCSSFRNSSPWRSRPQSQMSGVFTNEHVKEKHSVHREDAQNKHISLADDRSILEIPSIRTAEHADIKLKRGIPMKFALKETYRKLLRQHDFQVSLPKYFKHNNKQVHKQLKILAI